MTDLFGDTLPITLGTQLAEVERELELRRLLYPVWVASRKMTQAKADRHLAVLEAVAETLRRIA